MWRSLWRSVDRYSLQHFKHVIEELRCIKVVDMNNRKHVIDLLQSIVEIVTYGDRQDPHIFECFMEFQVLAEFVRVLNISRNSKIEAPLLQYLSIMIQNMDSEHAIYYCFSGDYINNIINHPFDFTSGDLASYYVSFLRAVSSKLNRATLCLLVNVQGDAIISFPLYSEALKFVNWGEKMIQTASRALTLSIYYMSDDMVYEFITTPPVSEYFSELVNNFRGQCVCLAALINSAKETCYHRRREAMLAKTDKIADDLYYFKDILSIGESRLNKVITQNLLGLLIIPIQHQLLQLRLGLGSTLSAVTSLHTISRLLQVVGGKDITNTVAGVLLHPHMILCVNDATSRGSSGGDVLSNLEIRESPSPRFEQAEGMNGNSMLGHLPHNISSSSHVANGHRDDDACVERSGILACLLSDNHSLSLASLFLLLILAENKDLADALASTIGASYMQGSMDEGILVRFLPQILKALLNVLASQTLLPAQTLWHTGWLLLKLLVLLGKRLDKDSLCLFNSSYEQSRENLWKELDGCWLDYVLDTVRKEWTSCKSVLEEKSLSKDPFFLLEVAALQQTTDGTSNFAWQRMVDAVKVFILHVQLKAFILKGDLLENPFPNLTSSPIADSRGTRTSSLSSASFGSEVSLGCGVPCQITFSTAGIRDIYLIPVAEGVSGKLILAEKHPFRSLGGVVIAIAPLAGPLPKIDEDRPSWLHLRIREFDPRFNTSKRRGRTSDTPNIPEDGRWTLAFPSAKACETACSLILEETKKQRSFTERALAPLLQIDNLLNSSDVHCL